MMNALIAMPVDVEASRWDAVLGRDRSQDGRFVYAVTSTRVFCRPSCPSRRPLRSRVRFFDSADAATRAGFRPCLRCHPLQANADPWLERVASACQLIARAEAPPTLEALATHVGSTRHHFLRNFTRVVGVTPRAFAEARRFASVKAQLRSNRDVTTAFLDAGYGSSSRFYEGAVPRLAMAPATYRGGGAGQTVSYACTDTPLGRVLVAATPKGVCSVALGDADRDLVEALRREYPRATVVRAPGLLADALDRVTTHLAGRTPSLELPLDVRATAFQWQVWTALRDIPSGETRTYAEVAAAIGRPSASRAVARACAANPVALAVPCHRVVPSAGGEGGYRWGTARKRKLLEAEQRSSAVRSPRQS